jgi:hypothetical protein
MSSILDSLLLPPYVAPTSHWLTSGAKTMTWAFPSPISRHALHSLFDTERVAVAGHKSLGAVS